MERYYWYTRTLFISNKFQFTSFIVSVFKLKIVCSIISFHLFTNTYYCFTWAYYCLVVLVFRYIDNVLCFLVTFHQYDIIMLSNFKGSIYCIQLFFMFCSFKIMLLNLSVSQCTPVFIMVDTVLELALMKSAGVDCWIVNLTVSATCTLNFWSWINC